MSNYMLFSGTANPKLAESIANYLEMSLTKAMINRFSDGEINVQISESVRGKDCVFTYSNPTCAPTNAT